MMSGPHRHLPALARASRQWLDPISGEEDDTLMHVTGLDRRRVSLSLVPPIATDDEADDVADGIVEPTVALDIPRPRTASDAARDRWEADGGHIY